jgi:hypothetical protein
MKLPPRREGGSVGVAMTGSFVPEPPGTSLLIFSLQMAAAMVCAVGGALAAGRKRLDMVGVVFVSFVAAVGGGSLRDLLLDRNPVFWLAQPSYLTVSLVAGALTWLYLRRWPAPRTVSGFRRCLWFGAFYDQRHPDCPRDGARHLDLSGDGV